MNHKITALSAIGILLSSCVPHEGMYSPACVAFEGSNIELRGGVFNWEKFSDQVIVDSAGNVVNQFPDYPLRGSYRIEDQIVHMTKQSGEEMAPMYLRREGEAQLLLTSEQVQAWEATGKYADCVLTLGSPDAN